MSSASSALLLIYADPSIYYSFTKEYLETSCDDGDWTHARVVIYNNRLFIKSYRQSDFTRSGAALALLYQALITAREPLPNVEFCIGLQDWGSRGKFSLDRGPKDEEVWLMPDYGWFSWPEHVGSYSDIRMKMDNVERSTPWEKKVPKLFWRGSMKVGTADRESLAQAAAGHSWNDVKEIDWSHPVDAVSMEDHCKWKFQGFPEGNTYSGRLRYLQNCKTVIVTHPPRWIQHWTHLYNADWNSNEQNIVYVPRAIGDATGVVVHDGDKEFLDRTWERLNEVMEALIKDDDKARSIAENQWNYFRNRYISPASAMCYWRKAIKGFGSVSGQHSISDVMQYLTLVLFRLTGTKVRRRPQRDGDELRVLCPQRHARAKRHRAPSTRRGRAEVSRDAE